MIRCVTNIFKCKKLYVSYWIMLILCFFIILLLVNTKGYYNDILKNNIGIKISNRKLIILNTDNNLESIIKTAPNIEEYYPSLYINALFTDLNVNLQYLSKYEYNLILGKFIDKKNEIIVPQEIEKYLNNDIKVIINNKEYLLNVVGVSDSKNIIISDNLLEELIQNSDIKIEYYTVISYSYKYVNQLINYFSQKGFTAMLENSNGLEEYNEMQKFISLLSKFIIFLIILICVFILYIFKCIFAIEIKNLAILKTIGYSNFQVSLIITLKIMLTLLISVITSLLIFIIAFNLIGLILKTNYIVFTNNHTILYNYFHIIILSSILLLSFNYVTIYFKIKKLNIINILNED